jgi:hypothetical protein
MRRQSKLQSQQEHHSIYKRLELEFKIELLLMPRWSTWNPALYAITCVPWQYSHIEKSIASIGKPFKNTTENWKLGSKCHPIKGWLPNQEPLLLLVSKSLAIVSKTIVSVLWMEGNAITAKILLLSVPPQMLLASSKKTQVAT